MIDLHYFPRSQMFDEPSVIKGSICYTIHLHSRCEEHYHPDSFRMIYPYNSRKMTQNNENICKHPIHATENFLTNEQNNPFYVSFFGQSEIPLKELSFTEYQDLFNEKFPYGPPSSITFENLNKFLDNDTKYWVTEVLIQFYPKKGPSIIFGIMMAGRIYRKFMEKYQCTENDKNKEVFLQKIKEKYENTRYVMKDAKFVDETGNDIKLSVPVVSKNSYTLL